MELMLRRKPHILSASEESLLSLVDDPLSVAEDAYLKLYNADLKFPSVTFEGKEYQISKSNFVSLLTNKNLELRKLVFHTYYQVIRQHENTFSSLLNGQIKQFVFKAKLRKYPSSLCASLFYDHIDQNVYDSLIEATHKCLPIFFKYVNLRRRRLFDIGSLGDKNGEMPKINSYDNYAYLIDSQSIKVPFDLAKEWIVEALQVMGDDYVSKIKRAFNERWIDVFETPGKQSGAFSSGTIDSYAYILLNYNDDLDSAFTLAHELGHSIHSTYSNENQKYPLNNYSIFVAEVASTLNECLLQNYLIKKYSNDKNMMVQLYGQQCDDFKSTFFRQAMFAEFEKIIHNKVESGNPLTPDLLKTIYHQLILDYFGPDYAIDDDIDIEWARIPHFYYSFYVYKYCTSYCASLYICNRLLDPETHDEMLKKYINFLKSGKIKDPLDLLKDLGIDMTKPDFIYDVMPIFDSSIKKLEELFFNK